MSKLEQALHAVALSGILAACSEFETEYFKNRVNEATAERVAKRYGTPHKMEKAEGGRIVWTYFDRGSGTGTYSGYARSSYCRVYLLTFDQDEVLRDWKEGKCEG
ncbi:MAG: hypothetical protein GDA67_01325 [Nitrospira sp. CR1.3]|nr:hypothetical protein [Nitrospira sp. CR1.3]